jgi:phosphate-selective porin OprO/OprP
MLEPDEAELQEEEATEILPDSEAIDETIEGTKEDEDAERPAAEPVPAPEPEWRIRWQNAFIVERIDDPTYQFLFGGRVHNDWGAYVPDDDLERDLGDDGSGTKIRRARLFFQGQFFRHGFFKVEYDFSNAQDNELTDVYMGISLPRVGLVRVGHFKEPFSLQFQNSSNFLSFNERAGLQAFSPNRNTGIMLSGNFLARDSTYAIGFFRRTDDVGEGFSSEEDYRLTARITALPYFENGGRQLAHLELGFSHQFADESEGVRYAYEGGSTFGPNLVDTGLLGVENVELFNIGLALVDGSFAIQSETALTVPHGGISENPLFWGTYTEVSWWITGERRRYLRGRGVFSRVVPKNRFAPEKGSWGAFELAARISWLDLTNDGIRGGELIDGAIAFNWVLFSNLRMNNNYVLSHARERGGVRSGFAHTWLTRFQIDF